MANPNTIPSRNVQIVDGDGDPIDFSGLGGGGGGGAVTVADGADVAQGAVADAAWTSGSGSVVALLKAIAGRLISGTLSTSTNLTQVGGTTLSRNAGNVDNGTVRVVLPFDQGSIPVICLPLQVTTPTLTRTAASATNVNNLVALNTNRRGLVIVNESSATLYIKFGTTASLTSYTYAIPAGATWEMPGFPTYTGRIDGIWSAANGNAQITELTA